MSAPERAPLGAALAMLLSVVSLTGAHSAVLMAGAIGVLSVLLAISWPELLELPSPVGTRLVMGASGIAGAGLALLTGQERSEERRVGQARRSALPKANT